MRKSHNNLFLFFIQWRKRASIGFGGKTTAQILVLKFDLRNLVMFHGVGWFNNIHCQNKL